MLIRTMGIDTTALESGPHEMALCFQNESMQRRINYKFSGKI